MKTKTGAIYFAFCVVLFCATSGCMLFVTESEFYVENDTGYDLSVSWVLEYDGSEGSTTDPIPPGESVMIADGELLEADELPPSIYFSSITIEAEIGGTTVTVYSRDPVDDDEWVRSEQVSRGDYIFTLTLTDDDLILPTR